MNGLLSAPEIAKKLKVHPSTVDRYCREGKLKGFKLAGGHWRVRTQDFEEFLNGKDTIQTN